MVRDGCSEAVLEREASSVSAEEAAERWCGGTSATVLAAEAHARCVTLGASGARETLRAEEVFAAREAERNAGMRSR